MSTIRKFIRFLNEKSLKISTFIKILHVKIRQAEGNKEGLLGRSEFKPSLLLNVMGSTATAENPIYSSGFEPGLPG